MDPKRLGMALVAVSLVALGFAPAVFAAPTVTFLPPSCSEPSCLGFNVNFTVTVDSNCPSSGGFYTFTYAVTYPNGLTATSAGSYGPFPCGSTQSFAPTGPHPGGLMCGTYSFEFKGTTYSATGAPLSTFDKTASITVGCPASVPEFGLPATMVAAVSLLALVLLRGRLLPTKRFQ